MWAYFATNPRVAVSRLFTDAHEPMPRNPRLLGFSLSWVRPLLPLCARLPPLAALPTLARESPGARMVGGKGIQRLRLG